MNPTASGYKPDDPKAKNKYLEKLSGPLLDRIDIQLKVTRITAAQLKVADDQPRLSTAAARSRVVEARGSAAARLAGTPWTLNSQVPGTWLRSQRMRLAPASTASIDRALERGGITMRGYDRVLKVGWTLADLDGVTVPGPDHIGRALYLRRAMS
jgi:magnesium chelatase family protein